MDFSMRISGSEVYGNDYSLHEKELWAVVGQMQDAFIILRAIRNENDEITDFIYSYINESGAKELKLPSSEIVGKKLSEIFPKIKQKKIFQIYCRVVNTGKACNVDSNYYDENVRGRIIKGLFNLRITKISDGCAVTWRNVTEKRKLEITLKKSEENFRLALQNTKITVVRIDRNLKVTWMYNPHPDFDPEVVGGTSPFALIDEKAEKNIRRMFNSVFETKKGIRFEQKMIVHGKLLDYELQAEPSFNSKGEITGLFVAAINITDRKNMELKLRQTMKKLEISNRELEQFAYVASHDLNEPIRIISSYSKLYLDRYGKDLDEKAAEFLGYIWGSSNRMQTLIHNLLEYSRLSTRARPFEKVDLNTIVNNVLSDLKMSIDESRAEILIDELPVINADPVQMHRLFLNLISNAIKFNDKDHPIINLYVHKRNDLWLFCIKDNGIGIESTFYNRIFQIFQRLHEQDKYSGTGIGLAMCKKIVERHKGRIWLKSKPGLGTTFYILLHR